MLQRDVLHVALLRSLAVNQPVLRDADPALLTLLEFVRFEGHAVTVIPALADPCPALELHSCAHLVAARLCSRAEEVAGSACEAAERKEWGVGGELSGEWGEVAACGAVVQI